MIAFILFRIRSIFFHVTKNNSLNYEDNESQNEKNGSAEDYLSSKTINKNIIKTPDKVSMNMKMNEIM